jgi:hypothetical protein
MLQLLHNYFYYTRERRTGLIIIYLQVCSPELSAAGLPVGRRFVSIGRRHFRKDVFERL